MHVLLESIQALFAADAALTAAFPGGLWGESAPESAALPYAVQKVLAAPDVCCYGTARRTAVQVQFTAYAIGRDAALAKAEALAAAFRDVTLTLSAGQHYDARQVTDPVPERAGRDAATSDDPAQGDAYSVHVTIEFAVRTQ